MAGETVNVRLGTSFQPSGSPKARDNFEPDTVDKNRGNLVEDTKGEVTLSFAHSTQSGEEHLFKGQQAKAKETEFVLIYDEDNQEYVLEKLASTFNMRNVRQPKKTHANISNLEDRESARTTASTIVGSTATTGLLKPPVNFSAKPKTGKRTAEESTRQEDEVDDFSDLEDLLVKDLSS